MRKPKYNWTKFKTEADIEGGYRWDEEAKDWRVKVFTPMPRGYYHSAQNDVGLHFEYKILPTLQEPKQAMKIDF